MTDHSSPANAQGKCSYCNGTGKIELTVAELNALRDLEMRDVRIRAQQMRWRPYDMRALAKYLYENCGLNPDQAGEIATSILSDYEIRPADTASSSPDVPAQRVPIPAAAIAMMRDIASDDAKGRYGRLAQETIELLSTAQCAPFAWLIEKGAGSELRYYAPTEPGEWTLDHLKACRFARKEDAEAIQFRHVARGHLPVRDTRVCEHGWMDNPAFTSPECQKVDPAERCDRCGSSGDVFVLCAGCHSPLTRPAIQPQRMREALIEAGDELYSAFTGQAHTKGQMDALIEYAKASNSYRALTCPDAPPQCAPDREALVRTIQLSYARKDLEPTSATTLALYREDAENAADAVLALTRPLTSQERGDHHG